MKIEKVTYQKTYSIGPYLTDRVGFEASITPPSLDNLTIETPEYVLSQLAKAADEWHRKAHPHLYQDGLFQKVSDVTTPLPEMKVEFRNGQQDTLDGIKSATTLEELSTFKKLSGNNKELYEAYNQRLKELSK